MRRFLLIAALAATAAGCQNAKHASVREMTVQELADLTKTRAATPVDANTEDFRKENGVIPGAIVLSNFRSYEISELGADKARQLVFYCSSRS